MDTKRKANGATPMETNDRASKRRKLAVSLHPLYSFDAPPCCFDAEAHRTDTIMYQYALSTMLRDSCWLLTYVVTN